MSVPLHVPGDRVWVVTEDGYEGTAVVGVYRTAELAGAAVEKVRSTPVEYMGGHMGRSHRVFNIDEHNVHDDDDLDVMNQRRGSGGQVGSG